MDQFLPAEHRLKKCGKKGFLKSFDNTDPTNAVLPPVNQTDTTNAASATNKISMTMTDGHAESIVDMNDSVPVHSKADNKASLNSTFDITIGESFSTQHNIKEEAESDEESDAINDFSIDMVDNLSTVNLELTLT